MIELPDVERMIDAFAGYATGKTVSVILIDDKESVDLDGEQAAEHVQGHAIDTVERHGKYVVLRFRSEVSLVFDLGTDGEVYLESQTAPPRDTSKIRLQFAAGRELRFASSSTGGDVYFLEGQDLTGLGILDNLGLDPLSEELTAYRFIQLARDRGRSTLKGLLINEEVVAGIGNEYADEICFQASIRPDCRIADLSDEQLAGVHKYLQRVLRRATLHWQAAHSDPGWLINRRRPGHTCPRCMTELESLSLVGKRTYLCPRCQRAA